MSWKLLVIVGLVLLSVPALGQQLFYDGNLTLQEEDVLVEVHYKGDKAVLDINATYLLKNEGVEQLTTNYSYYGFGKILETGQITLDKGESKKLSLITTRTAEGPPYKTNFDLELFLKEKPVGKRSERSNLVIKFPSRPTILSGKSNLEPNPDPAYSSKLRWSREDKFPGFDVQLSWIRQKIDIKLNKEIVPSLIQKNDTFRVRATVKNNDNITYEECKVSDSFMALNFHPLNEMRFEKATSDNSLDFWTFSKQFTLKPGAKKVFEYKIRFLGLGGPDGMKHKGFGFAIPSENYFKQSNRADVDIRVCNKNGICEPEKMDEYYKVCPEDCPSGSQDGYCDGIEDGKCDPDCESGQGKDPDCTTEGKVKMKEMDEESFTREGKEEPWTSFLLDPWVLGGISALIVLVVVFALSIEPEKR